MSRRVGRRVGGGLESVPATRQTVLCRNFPRGRVRPQRALRARATARYTRSTSENPTGFYWDATGMRACDTRYLYGGIES